jgi:hypothetical protein
MKASKQATKQVWVNINQQANGEIVFGQVYATKRAADECASVARVGCIKIKPNSDLKIA